MIDNEGRQIGEPSLDPPVQTPECPDCVAEQVMYEITQKIRNVMEREGVGRRVTDETMGTKEGLAFMDFLREDVEITVRKDGGLRCKDHKPWPVED